MYRIAVLAEQEAERQRYAEQITRFCEAKGLFPQVMQYDDQERFFETDCLIGLDSRLYGIQGKSLVEGVLHSRGGAGIMGRMNEDAR